MKIVFVVPKQDGASFRSIRFFRFPSLSLLILAALTPSDIETVIIDEDVTPIDFDLQSDLVAITISMTALVPRAYQIADKFREKGIPVIIGGIHATALPEEALKHADSIVLGEGENVWPQIIEDFRKKDLRPRYLEKEKPKLDALDPLRHLLSNSYATKNVVFTSRGCPFNCKFCSVTTFFGATYRCREIPEVIAECKKLEKGDIFFIDDNIIGNREHAKNLFQALIPLQKNWVCQATVNFGQDEKLLDLAAKSGCIGVLIGFESFSEKNIRDIKKRINLINIEEYSKIVSNIHQRGIGIQGAFIFGFDGDTTDVFEETVKFAKDNYLEGAQFTVLTPFPGTAIFQEFKEKIFDYNWSHYDGSRVVFHPTKMSAQELQEGFFWAYKNFYSLFSVYSRLKKSSFKSLKIFLPLNLSFRWAIHKHKRIVP